MRASTAWGPETTLSSERFDPLVHFLLPWLLAAVEDHEVALGGSTPVHVARCLRQALLERLVQAAAQDLALDHEPLLAFRARLLDVQVHPLPPQTVLGYDAAASAQHIAPDLLEGGVSEHILSPSSQHLQNRRYGALDILSSSLGYLDVDVLAAPIMPSR